ncbi:MAG: beta-lactamase family protein [Myxococcales bacterium]|nr:beta-lactamase family protein [Myxococcales bacterium]
MTKWVLGTSGLAIAWIAAVVIGSLEGGCRAPLAPRGDFAAFAEAAHAHVGAECRGNAVVLLIEDGVVRDEYACSVGEPVDRDSVFQVASLSKWISAWGVMALVDSGRVALDAPVSTYLERWHLPDGDFDAAGVTVRRLLSHTAGLTDGLGYGGFGPGERVQTIEESLTMAADRMPHASGAVVVGREPGSRWEYSGGGYALLQLLVEDVTGEAFESYMRRVVLGPLGMRDSTFDWTRAERARLADSYDVDATRAPQRHYTAVAAASLYTTASDLARFLAAHVPGRAGEPVGRGVLAPRTVEQMWVPEASLLGRDIWGLGVILHARNAAGRFVVGHDGTNLPAINTAVRLDPDTGDAIVALATGAPRLATTIAGEWVFWETGNVDVFAFGAGAGVERVLGRAVTGAAVIVVVAILAAQWRRRARPAGPPPPQPRGAGGGA